MNIHIRWGISARFDLMPDLDILHRMEELLGHGEEDQDVFAIGAPQFKTKSIDAVIDAAEQISRKMGKQ